MEQKGSKLLKIVSIIMMIGGIVSAVFSVIAAALAGVGTAVMSQPEVSDAIDSALATPGSTGNGCYLDCCCCRRCLLGC